MSDFRFFHPVEVRYGDLDPQGHLNNAKYLTYFEQARIQYMVELGLFEKQRSFLDLGLIMADVQITFRAPVQWGDPIKVGVRTSRIGNKSMDMEQAILNGKTGDVLASGKVICVAYDYRKNETIRVPDFWRETLQQYEGLEQAA
ncbi:MAG: acyl-CoA thioesterase [Bacteroidota bacterium]